jgi:hypothetical protein
MLAADQTSSPTPDCRKKFGTAEYLFTMPRDDTEFTVVCVGVLLMTLEIL